MSNATMTVQMKTSIAGARWSAKEGDEVTLPVKEAQRLIQSNQAVRLDSAGKPMPLEGRPSVEPAPRRFVSVRERGTKKIGGDSEGNTGEIVEDREGSSERARRSGRGVPSAERHKANPESLDDVEALKTGGDEGDGPESLDDVETLAERKAKAEAEEAERKAKGGDSKKPETTEKPKTGESATGPNQGKPGKG